LAHVVIIDPHDVRALPVIRPYPEALKAPKGPKPPKQEEDETLGQLRDRLAAAGSTKAPKTPKVGRCRLTVSKPV